MSLATLYLFAMITINNIFKVTTIIKKKSLKYFDIILKIKKS